MESRGGRMTYEEFQNLRLGDKIVFKSNCSSCPVKGCSGRYFYKAQKANGGYLTIANICFRNGHISVKELEGERYYKCFNIGPKTWSYERDY